MDQRKIFVIVGFIVCLCLPFSVVRERAFSEVIPKSSESKVSEISFSSGSFYVGFISNTEQLPDVPEMNYQKQIDLTLYNLIKTQTEFEVDSKLYILSTESTFWGLTAGETQKRLHEKAVMNHIILYKAQYGNGLAVAVPH